MTDAMEVAGTMLAVVVVAMVIALGMGLVFAFPIMWIWNWLVPGLFGLSTITFWQAFWLKFLLALLIPTTNVSTK